MRLVFITLWVCLCFSAWGRPNVILIMSDDQGAETCVPYGGEWVTPSIDSLADMGMRFTNMNSCPSCAASRATLLTSRYSQAENRHDPKIIQPTLIDGPMNTNEVTIADMLGDYGYVSAAVGKWNLRYGGFASPTNVAAAQQHAMDCGFDYAYIPNTGTTPTNYWTGGSPGSGSYLPDLINDYALDWIDDRVSSNETFFLYYNFHLIHTPYQVTPDNLADTNESDYVLSTNMYAYMDGLVSNLISRVESSNIASNTIVIYTGDNGTAAGLTNTFDGTPVTGGKASRDLKATRVPFYIRWDGVIETNSTYSGLSSFVDIMPTIAHLCGVQTPADRLIDGLPVLGVNGTQSVHRTSMYTVALAFDSDYKYNHIDGTVLSITNWPYGDDVIDPRHFAPDINAYIRLSREFINIRFKAYGHRPWGGSTNEYTLMDNLL